MGVLTSSIKRMSSLEFLINNNYAKRVLPEYPAEEMAAVCALHNHFEHVKWSGTIELALAARLLEHETNHIACFFGRGAYRLKGELTWVHPEGNQSLIGLVSKNSVMAIVQHGKPYLYTTGSLPELRDRIVESKDRAERPKSSVVSFASFKAVST